MKKGVSIITIDEKTTVLEGWNKRPVYIRALSDSFTSPYLSWENASYAYPHLREEEADDYLLNHALQDNRKLCVSIYTKDPETIEQHFKQVSQCDTYVMKLNSAKNAGYSIVFAVRKGCLEDYFDMDQIEDIFNDLGFKIGKLFILEQVPLIDFVTGNFEWDSVPFNMLLDTEYPYDDPVLSSLGVTALIVTGLMFGYPLEMIYRAMLSCSL